MSSHFIPPVVVQVVARAMVLRTPVADATACYRQLKDALKQVVVLHTVMETQERVVFTAQYQGRMVRVALCCATDAEVRQDEDVDILILDFRRPHFDWAYLPKKT